VGSAHRRTRRLEHAFAIVKDCTPELAVEAAVEAAMARAVAKYGPQDFTRWKLRAKLHTQPVMLREVHFEFRGGALRRL
jgi:hypothetical protein